MPKLTGWWDRRSDPARIELYTRWSFHFFALTEVGLIGGMIIGSSAPTGLKIGWYALATVHAVLCAVLSAKALDWLLDRGGRPVRLLAAVAVLSAAATIATLALSAAGYFKVGNGASLIVIGFTSFGLGAIVLCIRGRRGMLYALAGTAVGTAAVGALLGVRVNEAVATGVFVLVCGGGWIFTCGFSAWLLGAVWELDAARALQSRLAVAEERLRFGRDLHDVMGRNLAVIALKSELAVQLALRGRPEAVDEMVEVQRIARESQREVRDVVRGYRAADLAVELAGALSVLRAAGVEGRAEVDDASALPPGVQAAFGWVIREATTNVLRHSEARSCTIRLSTSRSGNLSAGASAGASVGAYEGPAAVPAAVLAAVLAVENDGVPDPPPAPSGGSGLPGLRERLAALGGTLAVRSQAGVFRLTAEVPLPGGESYASPSRADVHANSRPRKGSP